MSKSIADLIAEQAVQKWERAEADLERAMLRVHSLSVCPANADISERLSKMSRRLLGEYDLLKELREED